MNIKNKVLKELEKNSIPDLEFLYSPEVLEVTLELLEELLEEEKNDFYTKLKLKDSEINFEVFDEESTLDYFFGLVYHLFHVRDNEKVREIIEAFEPKYIDFGNEVSFSKEYYDMMVYCNNLSDLTSDQKRILDLSIKAFDVRGISLEEDKQTELKKINKKLSKLSMDFGNNVLDHDKEFSYNLEEDKYLTDFPKDILEQAKKRSLESGKKGYLFNSSYGDYAAIMKYCSSGEVRKDFYIAKTEVATKVNPKYDNRKLVLEILNQRKKKANILGYKNHPELALVFRMADSPEQVIKLLENISKKAKKKARSEIETLKKHFDLKQVNPWDCGYYFRRLKEEKYKLDEKKLREFFEFENTLTSLFDILKRLFGLEMKEITEKVLGKNPKGLLKEVRFYEAYKNGELISYFVGDYFFDERKKGEAWCNTMREKYVSGKNSTIPIVVNMCNFCKNDSGETLLTFTEVETLFHEFGHASHDILSGSNYSDLSGTTVERDFVELPSQLMENWVGDRESIDFVAKHYKTGNSIDKETVNLLEEIKHLQSGNFVLGQMEFGLIDMYLHFDELPKDVDELDRKAKEIIDKVTIFDNSLSHSRYSSFSHIFNGGYSAGYYSYMWAEIIEADIFAKFKENGIFDKKTADKYLSTILSQGSRKPASDLFFDFMAREVSDEAFLLRNGF